MIERMGLRLDKRVEEYEVCTEKRGTNISLMLKNLQRRKTLSITVCKERFF